ncbi:MAG TPA: RNA-binding domain-containing protein [Candidatus Thermoplasmatota archaeon]|nr:RNA-binding domain-containing protein [Candidatus Thermoplasmatota archaeon]
MPGPTFHYVEFRTSAHATEVEERVREAFHTVAGEVEVEGIELEGHHKNPIVMMRGEIKKSGEITRFWKRLHEEAPGTLQRLRSQLEARLGDDGTFYFRLDKQEAFLGRLVLTSSDDCIQVAAKVAAYPAKREVAEGRLRQFLDRLVADEGEDPA